MKSKIIIGKSLTSLLFLLLVSNFVAAGFSGYEDRPADVPLSGDHQVLYCDDESADSLDANFNLEKDEMEEKTKPFSQWFIFSPVFIDQFHLEFKEVVSHQSYERTDFRKSIPIWIFTRKIII